MTAAPLHLATPTAAERTLLRLADAITAYTERRRELRAERHEIALDILREQQSRKQDPRALDAALLALGSRPRR
jgi:HD-GYP domain-containing protein (c-di-GMP phosphodiesterase class II)